MRVIINGVIAGSAEHPRLAYLSQHCSILLGILGKVSIEAREQQNLGVPTFQQGAVRVKLPDVR
jgi:hypothetical protein